MSTTIDQRVVSLQFDNKQFERNTATTMSTLDKLKEKLTFNKASKGLEDVGIAAKNVNMTGLGSGVEAVTAKFSALQVMGITALANITNSAVNAGKRIASALTIDPIKTGFSEYETQINATQTILANVKHKGKDLDDVNAALEELNKYADQTIYNFTEMTKNIGLFTNAGVGLDESVAAIKGFSNAAAMSGADATRTSQAMYQLSQAMSAGVVKLMDWRSLTTANIAGERFEDAIKITARAHNIAIDDMIKKEGNLQNTLKSGWLTADLMAEALNHYTLSTKTMTEAEQAANRERLKSLGYTDKQIDQLFELGTEATSAATEVKTFSQLWGVLQESAQSGWSQTWKIIVGDFEKAKGLLTPLADTLTGFINKMSDWRNRILQIALDFSKPWQAISDKIGKVSDTVSKVTGTLEYFQDVVDKVWHGDFNNWGDNPDRRDLLKKAGYDPKVVQYLVNLGEEAHKAGKTYKLTAEDVEKAHKKYGKTVQLTAEETETAIDSFNSLSDAKLKDAGLTEDEIRLYRALEEEAAKAGVSVGELAKEMSEADGRTMLIDSFKNVGKLLGEIAGVAKEAWVDIFNPPSAEVLGVRLYGVIRSLKEFTKSLTIVDKETGKLTKNGENIKSIFEGLFAAIDIVVTLTAGPLKFVFKMFTQLCSVLGISVLDVAGGLGEFIVKIRDGIDGALDFTKIFEKIVPPIKNALSAFKDWIGKLKESKNLPQDIANGIAKGLSKAWTAVKNFFKNLPENISNGFDGISESPLGGFIDKLKSGCQVAVDVVIELGKMIRDKIKGFLSRATFEEISADSIAGLAQGLRDKASTVWDAAVAMVSDLVQKVKDFLGIHSPSTVFIAIGGFIVAGLIGGITSALQNGNGILQGFKDFFTPIIEWVKGLDMGHIFAGIVGTGLVLMVKRVLDIIDKFAAPMESLGDLFGKATEILEDNAKNFGKVIQGFAKNLKAEAFKTRMEGFQIFVKSLVLLIAAIIVLTFFDPKKLLSAIGIIAALGLVLVGLMLLMNLVNKASVSFDMKNGFKADGLMSGLLGLGVVILLMGATIKMLGGLNKEQALRGITLFGGIVLGLIALSTTLGLLNKLNVGGFGATIFKLAAGIAVLAIVVKLLGGMKPEKLQRGIETVVLLSGLIVGLMAATKLIGTGSNVGKIGTAMLGVAGAIALMGLTVRLIGGMKPSKLQRGIDAVTTFSALIVGLMFATRLIGSGSNIDKIGKALMGVAVAIGIMGLTVRLIGGMDPSELDRGTQVVAALSLMIVGLMAATKLIGTGSNVGKIGGALLGVAAAIGTMGLVVALLGVVPEDGLKRGLGAVTALSAIMVGLMAATKLLGGRKKVENAGSCLLAVAGAIGILAAVAIALGFVPVKQLAKGVFFVGILSAMMAGLMAVTKLTKFSKNAMSNLLVIAGIIALLGGLLIAMSYMETDKIAVASAALSAVIGMVALLMFATKYIANVEFGKIIGPMAALVVVVGLLAAIITVMANKLTNIDAVIPAAIALGIMMGAMAGTIAILAAVSKLINSNGAGILKGIGLLTLLLIPLAGAAFILASMSGLDNATGIIKALLVFVGGITLLLVPLALIGLIAVPALYGIGVMAVLVAALAAMTIGLGALVSTLPGMQTFVDTGISVLIQLAQGIGDMIAAFTTSVSEAGLLKVLAVFLMMPLLITGIALLFPLMLTIGAVATGIGALMNTLPGFQGFLETGMPVILQLADAIAQMIAAFTTTVSSAGLLEVLAVFAMMPLLTAGLGLLLPLMLVVGALATAVGGLISLFPQLEQFIDIGIPLLVKMAGGLGEMIGAFVGGVMTELASTLPQLGLMLSQFMINATPFIMGAMLVNERVLAGVGILAGAILALTAADLIVGVTSFLSGGSSFADLGTQLSQFMMNAMPFIAGAMLINEDMLSGVKALADTILILTAANVIEGLTSWLTGGSSLEGFAAQLPILGQGLAAFSTSLGAFTEDQLATVNCAAQAIKTLASAANEIPNTGGLLGQLVGENDLGPFAAQFPILGMGLRLFLDAVGTFNEDQVATVNCAADAVKALASASSEIPNTGGLLSQLVGENDLETFAKQFPVLGTGLADFLTNIGTFNEDQVATVDCAAQAIKALASAASEIPNSGGWIAKLVGENDLETFAKQFPALGTGIADFLTNIGTFNEDQQGTVKCAADAVKTLAAVASTIPNSGGWIAKIVGDNDLETFAKQFPVLGTGLKDFATNLGTFTTAQVSTVNAGVSAIKALSGLANADLSGAKKNISGFGDKLPDFAKNLNTFCTNMPSADSVSTAVANIDKLLDATKKIGDANSGVLKDFASNLKKVGEDAVKKFVGAFTSETAKEDLKSAATTLAGKAPDGAKEKKSAMMLAGNDLGNGLINGLNAKQTAVYNAGYALGQKAVQGEKDGQQSKSPSKLTIQAGKWLGEGLVIGIDKMGRAVYSSGYALGESAVKSTSSAISRIADAINTDIDAQPTIRPIMDLSDVRAGANTIGNLLNTESSVGVVANAGRIGGMMNRYSQNRGIDDVVAAIDNLNKRMDNFGNTTNIVNGVTYDDGSNINAAVQTLVRAARIERRT